MLPEFVPSANLRFDPNGWPITDPATDPAAPFRAAAAELIAAGYAVCRIKPGEKRPSEGGWTLASRTPDDFQGWTIGVMGGPLSHGGRPGELAAVGIDLDARAAVELTDQFLPPTAMVEGRPGKLRSHRLYSVPLVSIPAERHLRSEITAPAMLAQFGHPGPVSTSYKNPTGGELLKLIGTGAQLVCPPSSHPSGEFRSWEGNRPGAPPVVEFPELFDAAKKLASACGWSPKSTTVRVTGTPRLVRSHRTGPPTRCCGGLPPTWIGSRRPSLGRVVTTPPIAPPTSCFGGSTWSRPTRWRSWSASTSAVNRPGPTTNWRTRSTPSPTTRTNTTTPADISGTPHRPMGWSGRPQP